MGKILSNALYSTNCKNTSFMIKMMINTLNCFAYKHKSFKNINIHRTADRYTQYVFGM